MAIGKKLRFEVFKRDNFTCRYCGRKPPQVVLEPDHNPPRSKGGRDRLEDLVTSYDSCNRGKGSGNLFDTQPWGDDEEKFLEATQEMKEHERYQLAARQRTLAIKGTANVLAGVWAEYIEEPPPPEKTFLQWISRHDPEDVEDCIRRTSPTSSQGGFAGDTIRAVRYVQTLLSELRSEEQL